MDTKHYFLVELHAGKVFPSQENKAIYEVQSKSSNKPIDSKSHITLQKLQENYTVESIELEDIDEICKDNETNLITLRLTCSPL